MDQEGRPTPLFEKALDSRSQDLDELYCPTGAIWISEVSELKKFGSFYSPSYRVAELPWKSAIDIDDLDDLEMAEVLANQKYSVKGLG